MHTKIKNCSLRHIETMVPPTIVDNMSLDFDEKFKKKVVKNTGVRQRHVLDDDMSLLELYEAAGCNTLEKLGWERESIDGIIVVTQTPEYQLPATAAILQGRLELSKDTFAYDISMGCSGYIYGLYSAMSHIAASDGEIRRVLLFVGDAISTIVHPKNRSSVFLFGDAASCSALEYDPGASVTPFVLKSDGSEYRSIIVEDGGLRNRIGKHSFEEYTDEEGNVNTRASLKMDGATVFNFTVENVPALIEETLAYGGMEKGEISRYCFHQANKFMVDFLSMKAGIHEKTPVNIDKFGNTSSVSIPLLLSDFEISEKNTMLIGFGVGMSMGTCIVDLGHTSTAHSVYQKKD